MGWLCTESIFIGMGLRVERLYGAFFRTVLILLSLTDTERQ